MNCIDQITGSNIPTDPVVTLR